MDKKKSRKRQPGDKYYLIDMVVKKTTLPRLDVTACVEMTIRSIIELLAAGHEVSLVPLGQFKLRVYAARNRGQRVLTRRDGTQSIIPPHVGAAKIRAKFEPGVILKQFLNEKSDDNGASFAAKLQARIEADILKKVHLKGTPSNRILRNELRDGHNHPDGAQAGKV